MKIVSEENDTAKFFRDITVGERSVKSFKGKDGRTLFLLSSISKLLGYGDPNKLASLLDDDRKLKLVFDSGNGVYLSWFVDVLGLVSLIIKSRKLSESTKMDFINNYFILN